jgi:hypothetical protein
MVAQIVLGLAGIPRKNIPQRITSTARYNGFSPAAVACSALFGPRRKTVPRCASSYSNSLRAGYDTHARLRGSPLHLIRRSYSACVPIQTQIKPSLSSAASAR